MRAPPVSNVKMSLLETERERDNLILRLRPHKWRTFALFTRGWVLTALFCHLETKGVVTWGDNCCHTGMMARVFRRSLLRTSTPPQTGTIKAWRRSECCCLMSWRHFLHTGFCNNNTFSDFLMKLKVRREWMPTPANVSSISAKRFLGDFAGAFTVRESWRAGSWLLNWTPDFCVLHSFNYPQFTAIWMWHWRTFEQLVKQILF